MVQAVSCKQTTNQWAFANYTVLVIAVDRASRPEVDNVDQIKVVTFGNASSFKSSGRCRLTGSWWSQGQ